MTNSLTYIVAVSGGVDSVCLLHMLMTHAPELSSFPSPSRIIVAHVNHGIRGEASDRDEEFVRKLCESYDVEYVSTRLHLDATASEEVARDARYEFLEQVRRTYNAAGIVLAHHQGDVLETAIMNTLRGSGRRGLSSLRSTSARRRPLLSLSKKSIYEYAERNALTWMTDKSNTDPKYLRNRIRNAVSAKDDHLQAESLQKINEIMKHNDLLDKEIATILQYRLKNIAIISRSWFVKLPHVVACEIVHSVLSKIGVKNINRQLIEKITVSIKVARPGCKVDIDGQHQGLVTKRSFRIVDRTTLSACRL